MRGAGNGQERRGNPLDGDVEWQYQKDRAKLLVQSISGVRGVTNNITLKPRVVAGDVKTRILQGGLAGRRGSHIVQLAGATSSVKFGGIA